MYDFIQFMKPFVQMTEAISGEKWVTISHSQNHQQNLEDDSALVKQMKQLMLAKVNEYYGDGCDLEILNKSMLLDIQFKNVLFPSTDSLLDELTETAKDRSVTTTPVNSCTPSSSTTTSSATTSNVQCQEGKLMKLLADIAYSPDDSHTDPVEKAEPEVPI